jgi:hypothetical protein
VISVLILVSNEVDGDAREDYGKCMKVRFSLIKIDIANRLASLGFLGQMNNIRHSCCH